MRPSPTRRIAAGLLLGLPACATVRNPASISLATSVTEIHSYEINAGDELGIGVFKDPDLNANVVVGPDGHIALLMIGDLVAAGKTPAALASDVAKLYNKPQGEVTVNVRTSTTQRVFVGGEVNKAGVVPLGGKLTVLGAIMSAEGFKDDARTSEVVVIRRDHANPERSLVFAVNLDDAVSGSDLRQDLLLQPSDIVVVPRSGIGNVDLWVDQYLRRLLPFSLSGGYVVYSNPVIH